METQINNLHKSLFSVLLQLVLHVTYHTDVEQGVELKQEYLGSYQPECPSERQRERLKKWKLYQPMLSRLHITAPLAVLSIWSKERNAVKSSERFCRLNLDCLIFQRTKRMLSEWERVFKLILRSQTICSDQECRIGPFQSFSHTLPDAGADELLDFVFHCHSTFAFRASCLQVLTLSSISFYNIDTFGIKRSLQCYSSFMESTYDVACQTTFFVLCFNFYLFIFLTSL